MEKITIMNTGAAFDILPIEKAEVVKDGKVVEKAKYGKKITIPTGATVLNKLTAEYVCKVYATRCSIAGVGVSDDSSKEKIAELKKELEDTKAELASTKKELEDAKAELAKKAK